MKVKLWLALSALVLLAAGAASIAGGAITSVSGQVELIAAPPSVELGALTSDTTMRAFDEQQCVRLDADLAVDINEPGKYNQFSDLPDPQPVIAAGTYVSSHFVHADSVTGTRDDPIDLEGAIVTSDEILGIAALNETLNATDVLGAPGTTYPKELRGINFGVRQHDFVVEQIDVHTVVVHAENHEHADQVRVITKCPGTDIRVSKSDSPDPVDAGQPLTYTLSVFNAGPATAKNVVLKDTLPASVTFVSADAPCTHDAGVVTCNLGDLPNGATVSKQVVVRPNEPGQIVNKVCGSTDTPELDPSNNCDDEPTEVRAPPKADLWLKKWDHPDPAKVGQKLVYTLLVRNNGPDTAKDVVVKDTLPSSATFDSADAPCTHSAGVVTCALGDLAPGATVYKHITVVPTQGGYIVNNACVSSSTLDPVSSNNCDDEKTLVVKPKCKIIGLGKLGKYQAFAFGVANWDGFPGVVGYVDSAKGKTLKSIDITSVWNDASHAVIKGSGKVGSATVQFTLEVADVPGPDTFSISWPGYSASGQVSEGGVEIACGERDHRYCY
jgi:uncharacterized repeat protein (TIGR01451 family)